MRQRQHYTIALLSVLFVFGCSEKAKPAPQEKNNAPEDFMVKICVTAEPKEAKIKVQGGPLDQEGCRKTFPGENSIEASAPGYQNYQERIMVYDHGVTRHQITMVKASATAPASAASTSVPASAPSSAPASTKATP